MWCSSIRDAARAAIVCAVVALINGRAAAQAPDLVFSYQGRLEVDDKLHNGACSLLTERLTRLEQLIKKR